MKRANIFANGELAGELQELERGRKYHFVYRPEYQGPSVSLEMPLKEDFYEYNRFPPFFEGLLPEGMMLEALLKQSKIDRDDLMQQLITVGQDLVGNVTVEAIDE